MKNQGNEIVFRKSTLNRYARLRLASANTTFLLAAPRIAATAMFGILLFIHVAKATENGLNHYAIGVNTVFDGVLPAQGHLQFYNYSEYYDATVFNGSDGKKLIPGFHAGIEADAPRFIYTYPGKIGPFVFASGIIPTIVNLNLSAEGRSGNSFGFADVDIEPLYIGYQSPKHSFFAYIGTDIWLPNGSYSSSRLTNLGLNYWTVAPGLFTTWFPTSRIEISTAVVPEINGTNSATHYHSGSDITVDSSIHYAPFRSMPQLRFAIQGYVYKQFQNDTINGKVYLNGFRGQAIGLGPQIEYNITKRSAILFKYDREFAVKNRPSGSRFWIEFTLPIL